eukprot:523586-Pelagomonas_calceolata.AAC.1
MVLQTGCQARGQGKTPLYVVLAQRHCPRWKGCAVEQLRGPPMSYNMHHTGNTFSFISMISMSYNMHHTGRAAAATRLRKGAARRHGLLSFQSPHLVLCASHRAGAAAASRAREVIAMQAAWTAQHNTCIKSVFACRPPRSFKSSG